jgi:SAM-dependent methyltransferase
MTSTSGGHYADPEVVRCYESDRFSGWLGRRRWAAEQSALRSVFDLLPPGSLVLDCPVGNGRWTEQLLGRGHHVVGADLSPAMLDAARARLAGRPVRGLVRADATGLPFADGSAEVVFSHALTKHLPPRLQDEVFAEFARVARTAVLCSFSVVTGLSGVGWRLRRLPESYGRSWLQLRELGERHGLTACVSKRCTTALGVERTVLFTRS